MCRDVEGNLLTEDSEVINRWRQYFNEHLNGDEVNRDGIEPAADNTFPAPELQEIQQEIRKLKNNRAAGKYGGEKLARGLHWVISKIWDEEKLPEEWIDGVVLPIYKKCDKLDRYNFRGITLINAAYKVLSQAL